MLEWLELMSYVVTVVGLPMAIFVFVFEQRKERENEEEEVYQSLSDNYQRFLQTALEHADLQLFTNQVSTHPLTEEQQQRQLIVYAMLMSLFERAYLLLYQDKMSAKQQRRWHSWQDYMLEWCAKPQFSALLPQLLKGEDPEFVAYLTSLLSTQTTHEGDHE